MKTVRLKAECRQPIDDAGGFRTFPAGWVGEVDEATFDAMKAADAIDADLTKHPLDPPKAPKAKKPTKAEADAAAKAKAEADAKAKADAEAAGSLGV